MGLSDTKVSIDKAGLSVDANLNKDLDGNIIQYSSTMPGSSERVPISLPQLFCIEQAEPQLIQHHSSRRVIEDPLTTP